MTVGLDCPSTAVLMPLKQELENGCLLLLSLGEFLLILFFLSARRLLPLIFAPLFNLMHAGEDYCIVKHMFVWVAAHIAEHVQDCWEWLPLPSPEGERGNHSNDFSRTSQLVRRLTLCSQDLAQRKPRMALAKDKR
jgi:hypothetical protein